MFNLTLIMPSGQIFHLQEIQEIEEHIEYHAKEAMTNLKCKIQGLSRKSPTIVNIMRMRDIDVTWRPRTLDWNAHV